MPRWPLRAGSESTAARGIACLYICRSVCCFESVPSFLPPFHPYPKSLWSCPLGYRSCSFISLCCLTHCSPFNSSLCAGRSLYHSSQPSLQPKSTVALHQSQCLSKPFSSRRCWQPVPSLQTTAVAAVALTPGVAAACLRLVKVLPLLALLPARPAAGLCQPAVRRLQCRLNRAS
jgi:hypothetical protein